MLRMFRTRLVTHAARLTLGLFAITLVSLSMASTAQGAERAKLTWDTDQTDVDLHIWDASGNHAWFVEQDGIPRAELSTDIVYGFGPERFEEFSGSEGRTYTYGICYYGSNTEDETVPETVATVEIIDPDGQTRTVKRTLRAEKDAYYLGSSPQGPGFDPSDDWCADGPYHQAPDTGPAPDTSTGGGGTFEGCPRVRRRIGVVELCATEFTGDGPEYSARGNVRVNGSVYLGEGPVSVNVEDDTISAPSSSIAVIRGGQPIPVAGGNLLIDTNPVTDAVSNRDRLASMSISGVRPDLNALRIAGLPLSVADLTGGVLKLFLDRREGGGIIAQANVRLPFAGGTPSTGSIAVGVHGSSAAAVRALAGAATFGSVALPGGWGFNGLTLSYQEAGNTWQASGGLTTPAFGLDVTGGLADGQLDALGVSVAKEVPIGATGFIMTKVGGSVAGLTAPPLKISATASAKWGSIPGFDAAVLYLNDVTLFVDLAGSASLKGNVTFVKQPSPVTGWIDIGFSISPFRASGRLTADAKLGPIDIDAGGGVVMRPGAFTAAGSARGKLRGARLGSGRGVVSNKGLGITGRLCVWRYCSEVGAGLNWRDFPRVRYIGADVDQFVTASRAASAAAGPAARSAAASRRSIRVKRGRPFLFVDADGPDGTQPAFRLRAPGGRIYTTRRRKVDSRIVKDQSIGYTGLTVARPRPGRWTVRPIGASRRSTQFISQTVRKIKRIRVTRISPRGSRRKPISRRKGRAIKVRWNSRGLPRSARVNVYVTSGPAKLGQFVRGGKRARRSSTRIRRNLLSKGKNRIRLIVIDKGTAIDNVIARPVIRAR